MKFEHLLPDPDGVRRAASIDGNYRYVLMRSWNLGARHVVWIMLNPSTADGRQDDPTVRRCIAFSRRWGFGGLAVVNLYAWRSSNPDVLWHAPDPIGPLNRETIRDVGDGADLILAWGANTGPRELWASEVAGSVYSRARSISLLGRCANGQPRHPLYVRATTERQFLKAPVS